MPEWRNSIANAICLAPTHRYILEGAMDHLLDTMDILDGIMNLFAELFLVTFNLKHTTMTLYNGDVLRSTVHFLH